jgi:YHS domain-containing protein
VGFLARLIRILWVAVVVWLIARLAAFVLRRATQSRQSKGAGAESHPAEAQPLYRDPVCGTYVAAEISKTLEESGQIVHFCSEECLTRYRKSGHQAPSVGEHRMNMSA